MLGKIIQRKNIFLVLAVFFGCCVIVLNAQEQTLIEETLGPENTSITSIEVIGLKRTKPHIARYPLEQFLGRDGTTLDLNEVQAVVRDTGILEPTAVELIETEEGLILRLTVEEKWSIFPIPMVITGTGRTHFGFFFMDANAFGQQDQMVLGSMFGTSGWAGIAMYNHTPNRRGMTGWNGFFMYGRQERENMDKDEVIHHSYTTDQLRISAGLYYPFTDLVSISAGVFFTNISLKENNEAINPPEKGAMLLGFSPGFSFRRSSWDGYLLSQESFSINYTYSHNFSGSSFHQTDFRCIYEYSLIPGFRLAIRSGAVWKSSTDILFEEGPQKAQVDILPGDFSARHYAGISAGFEKHLLSNRIGTLSVLSLWQCVISHGSISGMEFDHGPSGGIRFYLSRLALPALGLNIAYNVNSGLYQGSFAIGMGF